MSKRLGLVVLLAAAMLWVPVVTADQEPTLESVERAIVEKLDALQSASATFSFEAQVKLSPDQANPMRIVGGGSDEYLKKDGVPLYRLSAWGGFSETAKLAQAQLVFDGKVAHYDALVPLFRVDETGTWDPGESFNPSAQTLFNELRKHVDLALLAPAKVGEQDVYVLEGTLKEGVQGGPVSKVRLLFAQDTGIPLKIEIIDKDGNGMGTLTTTDVKVNPDLSQDQFVFAPLERPKPPAPKPEASDQADPEADQK